ncbi:SUMF1/EgtB/PvdO family nonheme iron enzyme [Flavobacterium sp. SUN046]|uniref:SUMF1/EgtB/PvdO family nonheme iron enzyme n=1 Tax=Flavobacterium sp. SUN046 TaxID=3002440 RepID=UPI002DBAD81F|nr:SUMF1/EgtB/PvdO family nonheme iron enzyme [Flavobacterium sp. SUN046]MEC4050478.1 SUMF1/EgtB/PvdO family nonheme iron enzyme [Flavobacterium sp. SUN046]
MKKYYILLVILFASFFNKLNANNLTITSISVPDANHITFNIAWDNSWFTATNYDAVWIFIKSQDCSGTSTWDHVSFSVTGTDHTVSGGTGLYVEPTVSDGKGVFIRRNSNGFGSQSGTITLKFANAYAAFASTNFQVFGVEMVWVPTASFMVGDGSTSHTAGVGSAYNYGSGNTVAPFTITSEAAIAAGALQNMKGVNYCNTPNNYNVAYNQALSASFPKGYAGYYCMKYEISQQQYVGFLNTLSFAQQGARIGVSTSASAGTYAMTGGTTAQNRNGIVIKTAASGGTTAVFDTDLNHDGIYGDGGDIACNYLAWEDLIAYLDWSALRPMTELEYEKACRGTNAPTINEYPWGNNSLTVASSAAISGGGTANEASTTFGSGLCSFGALGTGPLRCGFAATATSGRPEAGGGYYGVFDMGGNVWEQCIQTGWQWYTIGCAGTATNYPVGGIIYTGIVGDGNLDASGNTNIPSWGNSRNTILKGGSWNLPNNASGLQQVQISDRTRVFNLSNYLNNTKSSETGGRGVRKP